VCLTIVHNTFQFRTTKLHQTLFTFCRRASRLKPQQPLAAQRTAAASVPFSGSFRVLRNSSVGMPAPLSSKTEASPQEAIVAMSFQLPESRPFRRSRSRGPSASGLCGLRWQGYWRACWDENLPPGCRRVVVVVWRLVHVETGRRPQGLAIVPHLENPRKWKNIFTQARLQSDWAGKPCSRGFLAHRLSWIFTLKLTYIFAVLTRISFRTASFPTY
jgi:hypothetical protein